MPCLLESSHFSASVEDKRKKLMPAFCTDKSSDKRGKGWYSSVFLHCQISVLSCLVLYFKIYFGLGLVGEIGCAFTKPMRA